MHKRLLTISLVGIAMLFTTTAAFADYTVGQKVEFRDDYEGYGGGWIPAVITKDYGPNAVERYLIKIEGYQEISTRVGLLRPTDGSPRMIPKNAQENNYQGPEAEAKADAITAKRKAMQAAFQQPAAQQPAAPAAPRVAAQPPAQQWNAPRAVAPQAPRAAQPPARTAPARGNVPPAFGKPPANTKRAELGKGLFPNGKPLGIPGQTNYLPNAQGQKSIICVAPPGQESYIGRWNLKAGGTWTTVYGSEKEVDGRKTWLEEYGFPVDADVLVINADGTWYKQFAGVRTTGNWFDLGQNVVQLVGFDNDDWTGSVIKGQMEIRSPTGMWEYGKRF